MHSKNSRNHHPLKTQVLPAAAPLFSKRFAILTLLTAFAASVYMQALSAQTQSSETASEQSTGTTSETETARAEPVAVKKEAAKPGKKTKTKPSIKAQSAQNADSYEATEEISEDLSVSYPVDI